MRRRRAALFGALIVAGAVAVAVVLWPGGAHRPSSAKTSAGKTSAGIYRTRGFSCPRDVRCFFISYVHGNDANAGTSEADPWVNAPGMQHFSGRYSPRPGDEFIFEGGNRWPNSAFPLVATGSGTPAHDDYYGVDRSWYTGDRWTRPTFASGGANITGIDSNGSGGGQDIFVDLRGHDYITVDDIAFDNFTASGVTSGYGSCAVIEMVGDQNITVNWVSITDMAVDTKTFRGPACFGVEAATYAPYAGNSIVENSYISGAVNSYATGILCVGNVEHNVVDRMIGEVYPCGHGTISSNLLEHCGDPFPAGASGIHGDAIQSDAADGTYYIHDNVISDTGADQSTLSECESMLIGNPGETDYVWNNVLYNINGNSISLTQASSPGVAAYVWNNSVEGGFAGTEYCVRSGHASTWTSIVIENNFCASTASTSTDPSLSAKSLTAGHNVLLTPSQASADGYTSGSSGFPYRQPSSGVRPTRGAGANLSSKCSGNLTRLCTTTTFAGQLGVDPRPSSGPWNAGAY